VGGTGGDRPLLKGAVKMTKGGGGPAGGGCHEVRKGRGGVPGPTGRRRAVGNDLVMACLEGGGGVGGSPPPPPRYSSGGAVNWYSNRFEPIQTVSKISKPFKFEPIQKGPPKSQKK
jgi:hypothetical protein